MEHYDEAGHINVGTGEDLSILELAHLVRDIVHPAAELVFDTTKPDGTPRKLLDVSRLPARLASSHCASGWDRRDLRMVCEERQPPKPHSRQAGHMETIT